MPRMAGANASNSVFKFDGVVRGHHVYKNVSSMKCCKVVDMNNYDEYTATIVKEDCIVGNVAT